MASVGASPSTPGGEVGGYVREKCQPCFKNGRSTYATVWCTVCEHCFCDTCEKRQKDDRKCRQHKILDIADDKVRDHFRRMKLTPSGDEQAKTVKELEQIMKDAASVKEFVTKATSGVRKQNDDLPEQIEKMKKIMCEQFDKLKDSITQKSTMITNEHVSTLDTKYANCDAIETATRQLINANQNHGNVDANILRAQIQPFKVLLEQQQRDLHALNFSIQFDSTLTSLLLEGREVGKLSVDKCDKVEIGPTTKPVTLTLLTSLNVKKSGNDPREPLWKGLSFLPDERLVVVDNQNRKLYVLNERLEKLAEYEFDDYVHCVTVISADRVAVTHGAEYKLLILRISNTNNIRVIKTLRTMSKYDSISLMNDGETFISNTWDDIRPVRMITMDGDESDVRQLVGKDYDIDESACTYVRKTDTLVFTERFSNTVYLYDMKGSHFVRRVVKNDRIVEPRGACEGPDGSVFVCCYTTHSLVHISPAGRVIGAHKLGNMTYPWSVCTSQDQTKLAVYGHADMCKKLQVFRVM